MLLFAFPTLCWLLVSPVGARSVFFNEDDLIYRHPPDATTPAGAPPCLLDPLPRNRGLKRPVAVYQDVGDNVLAAPPYPTTLVPTAAETRRFVVDAAPVAVPQLFVPQNTVVSEQASSPFGGGLRGVLGHQSGGRVRLHHQQWPPGAGMDIAALQTEVLVPTPTLSRTTRPVGGPQESSDPTAQSYAGAPEITPYTREDLQKMIAEHPILMPTTRSGTPSESTPPSSERRGRGAASPPPRRAPLRAKRTLKLTPKAAPASEPMEDFSLPESAGAMEDFSLPESAAQQVVQDARSFSRSPSSMDEEATPAPQGQASSSNGAPAAVETSKNGYDPIPWSDFLPYLFAQMAHPDFESQITAEQAAGWDPSSILKFKDLVPYLLNAKLLAKESPEKKSLQELAGDREISFGFTRTLCTIGARNKVFGYEHGRATGSCYADVDLWIRTRRLAPGELSLTDLKRKLERLNHFVKGPQDFDKELCGAESDSDSDLEMGDRRVMRPNTETFAADVPNGAKTTKVSVSQVEIRRKRARGSGGKRTKKRRRLGLNEAGVASSGGGFDPDDSGLQLRVKLSDSSGEEWAKVWILDRSSG